MGGVKPTLTDVLTADKWWFAQFGESLIPTLPTRHLIFKDNGSDILGVGHLDTVECHRNIGTPEGLAAHQQAMDLARHRQTGPQLDDRLGVWAMLSVLPEHMEFDVLLTDNEEIGQSTAAEFTPPSGKQYNWVFELDRRGDGCVLYQYGSKKWNKALHKAGFRINRGSFSDIGYLDHLGVQCVNIGIGYQNEHTLRCDWDINVTRAQIEKLIAFYQRNRDKRYAYTHSGTNPTRLGTWTGGLSRLRNKPVSSPYHYDPTYAELYLDGDDFLWPYYSDDELPSGVPHLTKFVNGREYEYTGFHWRDIHGRILESKE